MLASYQWLCSLLPGLEASADEVGEQLTRAGLEIEEIISYGAACPSVCVAEVRKVEKHPKRDRLTLVTVERGGAEQTVVCGAPNVPEPGRKVVLAPLGTELPAVGITVAGRAIGGIVSEGMLCSELELGLIEGSGKGDGIMVLPSDFAATNGTLLSEALVGCHDTIFDIGVTPNRPDALGHVGLARELATLFDLPFELPAAGSPPLAEGVDINALASVVIEDTERCPRYGAGLIVDVTVGPSPPWLRYRLESLGIRAISNIVDVTNLVLLEHCQPLHAFDLDKLPEGRVVVRRAKAGERMTTLDEVERTLDEDDLLITDGRQPIALAGVMGGADSEVSESTRRILLECAYFSPRGVRRSSRRHGLHTEASHRFERGCDPEAVPTVLARATALLSELSGGKAAPGAIIAGIEPPKRQPITLRQSRMNALLGMDVELERAATILQRLGCPPADDGPEDGTLRVVPPSFRPDIQREVDLIEEVMRIHGIDEVPTTMQPVRPMPGRSTMSIENKVRRVAATLGLSEALTFGFVARSQLAALGAPEPCVLLKNPLTEDRCVMRSSLLPGLLDALKRSRRHGVRDLALFTAGRIFLTSADDDPLPREPLAFAAVLAGQRVAGGGLGKAQPVDVYDAKGVALDLIAQVLQRDASLTPTPGAAAPKHLHPRGAAAICVNDETVGRLGPLHPDVVDELDLDGSCVVIEIDLAALEALGPVLPQYQPIPTLPSVTRDLALCVRETVPAGQLQALIRQTAGELCESVSLFDLYRGKGLPDDHRSLAYRLVFRDPRSATDPDNARTLTDQEVDRCTAAVVATVGEQLGATVRG